MLPANYILYIYDVTNSIFLYFFLSVDTGSLNSIGSRRRTDRKSGMYPQAVANVFKHDCRCTKCSGSLHEDLKYENRKGENGTPLFMK